MTFKNCERTLARALISIIKQTTTPDCVILIDDGSTDSSLDIALRFEEKKVRVFSDGKNLGLATRLNEGIELTKTKYLARMDADDIMHPERLRKQKEYLESNPIIDILSTGYYLFIDDPFQIVSHTNFEETKLLNFENIAKGSAILHPSVMGKTDWFKNNKYDALLSKCQDQELWERTVSFSNFARLSERLFYYKIDHPVNIKKIIETQLCSAKIAKARNKSDFKKYKIMKAYAKIAFYKSCQILRLEEYISNKRLERLPKDRMLIQNAKENVKEFLKV
ncbi:glycosyltransferase family 2 protein [Halomonas sp. BC04]|uniref:glycosyltransferase family A protein n=1 Tax=Halomonas sp. BC04 TaxID=1403540 RepID=UPI001E351933